MKCDHCKLSFPPNALFKENNKHFCCKGCALVYELLHQENLDEFYQMLGSNSLHPINPPKSLPDYSKFIQKSQDGFSLIYLSIKDIHCQACIWLNEKVLIKLPGILELDINPLNNKARIVFDGAQIKLDAILQAITSIGYTPTIYERDKEEATNKAYKRAFIAKLIVTLACLMNIMWLAVAKYAGFFSGMTQDIKDILSFAEFILATPILFYTGSTLFSSAYFSLKRRFINMDCLVISGALLAYFYSIWAMFSKKDEVYFDSVAMIITFIFIGKYLELLARQKASSTLSSLDYLTSNEVKIMHEGKQIIKDIREVSKGEIISLISGDKVLIDGVCTKGSGMLDTSSLSGESLLVPIKANDELLSGSLLAEGALFYKASKTYENSTLAKLINLLESASFKKPRSEIIANKISSYFSIFILGFAIFTLAFWGLNEEGFKKMISVLIIACPCALALATPVTNIIALSRLLSHNILFKRTNLLEELNSCKHVVFDKTGVLATKLELLSSKIDPNLDKALMLAFFKQSLHPLAYCVCKYYEKECAKSIDFEDFASFAGKGIRANYKGNYLLAGSHEFLKQNGIFAPCPKTSALYFAINHKLQASFYFKSMLNPGTKELCAYLNKRQIKMHILSGDNTPAVKAIADELGIKNYHANCLPQDKLNYLQELGKHVLMIGDGVNDAPSLRFAPVSISLKGASPLAIECSDILLLNPRLTGVYTAFSMAKKSVFIIKQNLSFSILYNATTIPLAFFGYLNPLFAALSMSFSSLVVILNALRLR